MSKPGEHARNLEGHVSAKLAHSVDDEAADGGVSHRSLSLIEATSTFEAFVGPAPHPDLLQRYERIVPGSARELLDAVKEERLHRYRGDEFERKMLERFAEAEIGNARLGLIFGFVIGMTGLVVACVCALTDHEMTAAIVAGVDLLALVAVFVTGRVYEAKRAEPLADDSGSEERPAKGG